MIGTTSTFAISSGRRASDLLLPSHPKPIMMGMKRTSMPRGTVLCLGSGAAAGSKAYLQLMFLIMVPSGIGGTVALGQGVAIHGDPVGKEDVEDHRLAVGAVRPCHLPRLPDLDEPNVIGRCLDDRHVVGLVDGAADAAVDRGGDAIESVLSLDRPHRSDAGVAVAVEDQPGRAVELALDLAAFALESELLGHL